LDANLKAAVQSILKQKTSVVKANNEGSVLYQYVPPVMQLIIVGAGNDAQPLMDMAALLGWNIIVVDGRPAYATQQRFPKANKIWLSKPEDILSGVKIDEQTAVVLMTHNYNYDLAALEQFLKTSCNYIGLLGPKKKLHKMLDELKEKGMEINDAIVNRIYGPVGLDIGAETSEEIALSIIAEIKAVFSNRRGASLKERRLEIHERS
jgi:xanthine/CO dehydrogenase XdhC/CoxF family maturation factor